MTWNKALLAIVLSVVALGVAAFIYANSIDFNRYKAGLLEELQTKSGRAVAIDGGISLSFGVDSSFVIDGLRIGNPGWATRDDMIRVGRIEARFPVGSLLTGALRVDRLILYDVDLWLETKGPKRANWHFIDGETQAEQKPAAAPRENGPANRSLLGMLGVGGVDVSGARVSYRNAETGLIQVVELTVASAKGNGFSKPVDLEGEGVWNGLPLSLRGQVGSLEELVREGGPSYKVDLSTSLGGVQITASGNLANPNDASGINLAVKARADSLQGLAPVLGDVAGRLKHMTLTASLAYIRERFVLGDVRFGVGDSSMTGNLSIDLAPTVPVFDGVFNSPRIDLSALLGKPAGEPAMAGGAATQEARPAISREVLPWHLLSAMNGRLSFRGGSVQVAGVTLQSVEFDATLRNGEFRVAPLRAKLADTDLDASLSVVREGSDGRFALAIQAPRLAVGGIVEQLETVRSLDGLSTLRLSLAGAGDSLAGLFGRMSGSGTLRMGRGKLAVDLPEAGVKSVVAGPGAVFGMLVPKEATEVDLKCVAIHAVVRDGVLRVVGSVAESEAAVVVADGYIDFSKERINLRFTPRSRGPALWLATQARWSGSLAAPEFGVVPGAGPASEGGALSPLAVFFDRLLSSTDDACTEAGKGAGKAAGSGTHQAE